MGLEVRQNSAHTTADGEFCYWLNFNKSTNATEEYATRVLVWSYTA
jgi:hypothetical protein